jgi:hypothetical protein
MFSWKATLQLRKNLSAIPRKDDRAVKARDCYV